MSLFKKGQRLFASVVFAGCIATLAFLGCRPAVPTLSVISFPDYFAPGVIAEFERLHHCRVILDALDSGDTLATKLTSGGDSAYDVVGGIGEVRPLSRQGLLLPIRVERIPNLVNLDPRFNALSMDEGIQYSVPYVWGTTGIYLRRKGNEPVEESWAVLFDPAKQFGSFFLLNESRTCIGAALRYKGYSVNSVDPKQLTEARDLLIEAKKRSLGFIEGTASKNRILSRGADAAMAWGDCASGPKEDAGTHYFMPKEGAAMILDGVAILAKAPHRELAEKFLNHLLDPKMAAQTANTLRAPTPNRAALEFIRPEDRTNRTIYPPADQLDRLEMVRDVGEHVRLYDEIWSQIKSR